MRPEARNRFSILIRQSIDHGENSFRQQEKQFTPVVPNAFRQVVGGVLAKGLVLVDDDSAIEILTGKWQRENRLCQTANAMAMPFSNATSVKQLADAKYVEKRIDVSMNTDAGLSLGSNALMNHLGLFFLILLCFLAKPLYIKRLGLSTIRETNSTSASMASPISSGLTYSSGL